MSQECNLRVTKVERATNKRWTMEIESPDMRLRWYGHVTREDNYARRKMIGIKMQGREGGMGEVTIRGVGVTTMQHGGECHCTLHRNV